MAPRKEGETKEKAYQPLLLLLSGLGADSNLFAPQKRHFDNLIAPEWLRPKNGEPIQQYANRWINELRSQGVSLDRNTIVGGASFGGIIAQQMAKQLGVKNCILFGSIKCSSEVPRRIRYFRPIHKLAFRWIIRFWQAVVWIVVKCIGRFFRWRTRAVLKQFCRSDAALVKWSIFNLFLYARRSETAQDRNDPGQHILHIHQIHGELDSLFPIQLLSPRDDTVTYKIDDAGHLLTLSHAKQVNQIIEEIIADQTSEPKHC